MRFLHNMSLRRKQMLIIMLTSSVALLLACAIFVGYDVISFRKSIVKKVSVLAEAVGNNCTGAIEFNDPGTAEETLSALRAEPAIVAACVYNRKGEVFAVYTRAQDGTFVPPPAQPQGCGFESDLLRLFHPIKQRGETICTIYVASDLTELNERLFRYPVVVGEMFAAALLLAFVLSARLQRVVSGPILHLARVARIVALDKNYSVRAQKQGGDELGQLIDGFNEMLTQIQERDTALRAAHDNLEHRVRERTEELRQSQALYHSLVEYLPVHVYRKDAEGRFVFVNSHFCEFLGLPEQEVLGRTVFEVIPSRELAQRYADEDQMIMRNGVPMEQEQKLPNPVSGTRYLQVIKSPVFGPDHKAAGIQGMSFDITGRKEAEAKLQETHRELVKTSRQAGMAEVATSVLHNVGNVLNSINVTAMLIADRMKASKTANLTRVIALMRQHETDLGAFLGNDPKGRQILDYLESLGQHLIQEENEFLKEIESLQQNVDHIKNIVVMQQTYARISGVVEIVKVSDLVEDALNIDANELERHHVELIRDYDPDLPVIRVDKHKVLQILVNLIRNARHACSEAGQMKPRLTIRTRTENDHVQIVVADNGVGILPENLTRIFNHGFTTRKDGHGFGLHSGALAAKEAGGRLTAHSDGPGQGATFTLDLPLQPVEPSAEGQTHNNNHTDRNTVYA